MSNSAEMLPPGNTVDRLKFHLWWQMLRVNDFLICKLTVRIAGWQPATTGKADAVYFAGF
jgi:hypothetical protein